MRCNVIYLCIVLSLPISIGIVRGAQNQPIQTMLPYQNPTVPVEQRVRDLISRMTLEEKISQMVNTAPAIERLGIPAYDWWNECLHGVARAGIATVFPQAIGLGATWDPDLMYRVATAISDEARAKYHDAVRNNKRERYLGLTYWSPNINIFRDPRWGRGQETYGEDPYLTSRIAVAFVKGLQGNDPAYLKLVATPKHYAVHSGPEPERHTFNAVTDERDLRETYLPAFKACIQEAHAYSIMCAYNRYQGEACCGSSRLLQAILRNEWGFNGFVVSDCDAVDDIVSTHKLVQTPAQAAALAVRAGCDLNCGERYLSLGQAVTGGLITISEIDTALARLFTARFKLGMFDPPNKVPYATIPFSVVDCEQNSALALETAQKSIVLLKNDKLTLPFKKDLKTIAVIGPNSDDVDVLLGNYNGTPSRPVTVLSGIRKKVSGKTEVLFAQGCAFEMDQEFTKVPQSVFVIDTGSHAEHGISGHYFDNKDLKGAPLFTRIDKGFDFDWGMGAPDDRFDKDNFGVRWTGFLVPEETRKCVLSATANGRYRIFINDSLYEASDRRGTPDTLRLVAGKPCPITVEFGEGGGDAGFTLLWTPGKKELQERARYIELEKNKALAIAKKADAVVMVMGISPKLEGEEMPVTVKGFEGGDRLDITLPDNQEELIRAIQALGKPAVLVLLSGSALAINWASTHVPAILQAWYPGQAAGTAIADVLFGDYNPSGRLPITFYKSIDQLPAFTDYTMRGRTYRYFKAEPLYPFGHGLSYTQFTYSDLQLPDTIGAGDTIKVSVNVKNSGKLSGEEVVQLYVKDMETSVPAPLWALQGFKRIRLDPGSVSTVEFILKPDQLSLINKEMKRVVEPGWFKVSVGGRLPDSVKKSALSARTALEGRFKVTGPTVAFEE